MLTDADCERLLALRKVISRRDLARLRSPTVAADGRCRRAVASVSAESGDRFDLHVRQAVGDIDIFCVTLQYRPPSGGKLLTLRRYDAHDARHRNPDERTALAWRYHIHRYTTAAVRHGWSSDAWAEESTRFADLQSALDCCLHDAHVVLPDGGPASGGRQLRLPDTEA